MSSADKTSRTFDQSKNGVRVKVTRYYGADGLPTGSVVEADCACFGARWRCHSSASCPNLKPQAWGER